jgi:hypothetical protein
MASLEHRQELMTGKPNTTISQNGGRDTQHSPIRNTIIQKLQVTLPKVSDNLDNVSAKARD